ncbi:MAG: cell wall-binding repeat-containing protein, partial [Lachnospiraceae bacterium]|nr:cell wall-binding repeat-containing protein [Candidatus Equihabitans merdae]
MVLAMIISMVGFMPKSVSADTTIEVRLYTVGDISCYWRNSTNMTLKGRPRVDFTLTVGNKTLAEALNEARQISSISDPVYAYGSRTFLGWARMRRVNTGGERIFCINRFHDPMGVDMSRIYSTSELLNLNMQRDIWTGDFAEVGDDGAVVAFAAVYEGPSTDYIAYFTLDAGDGRFSYKVSSSTFSTNRMGNNLPRNGMTLSDSLQVGNGVTEISDPVYMNGNEPDPSVAFLGWKRVLIDNDGEVKFENGDFTYLDDRYYTTAELMQMKAPTDKSVHYVCYRAFFDESNLPNPPADQPDPPANQTKIVPLAGSDRYATNVEIAQERYGSSAPSTAVFVKGSNFPDALAANGYAGALDEAAGAPILLSELTGLPAITKDLLKEWGGSVKNAVIIGGGFTDAFYRDLKNAGIVNIKNLAGPTRYETAEEVLKDGLESGYFNNDRLVIATGQKAADALSVSGWCYLNRIPLLLAGDGKLSESTKELIRKADFKQVILTGGEGCCRSSELISLGYTEDAADKGFIRLWGNDRYETS